MNDVTIVANLSDTQRLVLATVEVRGAERVELRKEWRRSSSAEWKASKGITIPMEIVPALTKALSELGRQE